MDHGGFFACFRSIFATTTPRPPRPVRAMSRAASATRSGSAEQDACAARFDIRRCSHVLLKATCRTLPPTDGASRPLCRGRAAATKEA